MASQALQCSAKHDLLVRVSRLSQFRRRFPIIFRTSLVVTVSRLNRHEYTLCFHAKQVIIMTTFWKGFRHSTIQRFVHSVCSQSSYVRREKWIHQVNMISSLTNLFSMRYTVEIHQLHWLKQCQELLGSKTLPWFWDLKHCRGIEFIHRGKITYPLKYQNKNMS